MSTDDPSPHLQRPVSFLPMARARLIAFASLRWFLALTPIDAYRYQSSTIHITKKCRPYQFGPEARFCPCLKRKARAIGRSCIREEGQCRVLQRDLDQAWQVDHGVVEFVPGNVHHSNLQDDINHPLDESFDRIVLVRSRTSIVPLL